MDTGPKMNSDKSTGEGSTAPDSSPGRAPAADVPAAHAGENDPAAEDPAPPPLRHDPYAALRFPAFRRMLVGSMLGTIALKMQTVAVGWEIYERTGSKLALGLVGLVQVVPVLCLSLPAGHTADTRPRKRIILSAQALLGVCSLMLAFASSGRMPLAWMYAALGLTGAALAFAMPARSAILPQLVPAGVFANAVAWRTSGWQISSLLGPTLGGVGLAAFGRAAPVYACAAATSVVVILILAGIMPKPQRPAAEPLAWSSLLAGVRFVARKDLLLAAITLDMFAVLFGGATFLLPVFAKDILRVGPIGLGWLEAAPSLGAAAMALVIAHRRPPSRAGISLLLSVALFGVAMIFFALSRSMWLSFGLLACAGALDNISVVIRGTLIQSLTPDEMRGRVGAVNSVFVGLSNELGGFESGLTAEWFGPVRSVLLGGTACVAVVAVAAWRWPSLVRLGEIQMLGTREVVSATAAPAPLSTA